MSAKFTVYKDKSGKFRFNLKAANGEIIAVGESYPDKKSCLKGVASIQKNAAGAKIVDSTVEDASKADKPKAAKAKPKAKKAAASKAKKPAASKAAAPKAAAPKPAAPKPAAPKPAAPAATEVQTQN